MNASTTPNPASASTSNITLGWNAMPAYGEIMTELRGVNHMEMPSINAPATKTNLFMESFWNTVRSQFLAMAA